MPASSAGRTARSEVLGDLQQRSLALADNSHHVTFEPEGNGLGALIILPRGRILTSKESTQLGQSPT
jgi:hypothetical protein